MKVTHSHLLSRLRFINRTARKVPTWKELTNCYDIREFSKVAINLKGNKMTLLLQLLERLLV